MNLILIGYRATGKTTLARLLAGRLGWPWIDADAEIERVAGKSIAAIFAEEGEAGFRVRESQVVAELCGRSGWVLAMGGGAPLRVENRQAMRQSGRVVWLTASPQTIWQRMSGDETTPDRRPSLTVKPPLDEISYLLESRAPVYQQCADLVVDGEGRRPEQLADEILTRLEIGESQDEG
jgi:shikimate kinase